MSSISSSSLSSSAAIRLLNMEVLATARFQLWSKHKDYKLKDAPFLRMPSASRSDWVQYNIMYRDPITQQQLSKSHSIVLGAFLEGIAKSTINISQSDFVPIADLISLHLEIPELQTPPVQSHSPNFPPVFSDLEGFAYLGDSQQLEQDLGIDWSISFPKMKLLNLQGLTAPSTFRKVLASCPNLSTLKVNALTKEVVNPAVRLSSPPSQIRHDNLQLLEVVSNVAVDRPFAGLELTKLRDFTLGMMPKAAMGLRPEDLHIGVERVLLKLNFQVDEAFKNRLGIERFKGIIL
ncbi:hypothetical protein BDN72DRAFT_879329 [Pluteus cervinus]|uniref:Uncharacterized protein n=1 Tax=Pluteus cervinus TaxID=181527 RepID=A0ACD3AQE2_9AGAR|nr:hypothetical protein BDN72DRAFT_879329 [Pluteus cervinus]